MRAAFLIAQHPAINHALLLREVRELRRQGLDIATASIRGPDRPPDKLGPEEMDEAARTFYVKSRGAAGALGAILAAAASSPLRFCAALWYALRLAGLNLGKWPRQCAYFAQAAVVGRWMRRNGLRHLHVQYSSTVGLLVRRAFDIELSISFHGPDEFNDPEGFFLRAKIEACTFVRAISHYARSQLMKSCGYSQWSKIEVAYLGVDPAVFPPRPFRANPDPAELLTVGRLAPVKAQHILVDAVHLLASRGRRLKLHIAGGGPDRDSIAAHIARLGAADYIALHGFTPQDELDRLYRRADIFLLPSFAEGVPGVLMEAMAMEIPCVATRIAGVPELIEDGVDGLLAPPSDAAAFADAVDRLLLDPALRERMGAAARAKIERRFHLERNAAALLEIFRRRGSL